MSRPLFDQSFRQESTQLPAGLLAPEFGKIYVRDEGPVRNVEFTIRLPELEGAGAEGWQTGVALDASACLSTFTSASEATNYTATSIGSGKRSTSSTVTCVDTSDWA